MSQSSWIGKTLGGRYKIEELLGQGGMSAVYKATDPNLRRVVAIKMIHSHLSSDPGFVRRFEEEAAAVAQLRHPNIVQVYDFNHDDDLYYMVLEFVPGETLQDHLRRLNNVERRLPLKDVIIYATGVCDAIDYAHQRGLIHRDIKPANIMLSVMGQAILMDFGIAKIIGGQQHTATGAVVGTAMYMSPEQIKGENPDRRADIYSMGVTLFEMVSGHPPFEADSAMSLMMMHINDPVPDLRKINPDVPADLVSVINRALEKNPNDRFQTTADMATALRQVQERQTAQPKVVAAQPENTLIESAKSGDTGATIYEKTTAPAIAADGTLVEPAPIGRTAAAGTQVAEPTPTSVRPSAGGLGPAEKAPSGAVPSKKTKLRPAVLLGSLLAVVGLVCLVAGGVFVYSNFFSPDAIARRGQNPAVLDTTPTGEVPIVSVQDTQEPTGTSSVALSPTDATPTEALVPAQTPSETLVPTPTIPAGIPFSRINTITIDGDHYVVEYETFEFTEQISATTLHVHFFFDTVPPEEAGTPGSGPWKLYGGPRPFEGYLLSNRPPNATQMCILVANPNHSVQPNSGNCVQLPDVDSPDTTPAANVQIITDDSGVQMALVPAGPFTLGNDDFAEDEKPAQEVILEDYYLDVYEVTNTLYASCVDAGVCVPPSDLGSQTRASYFGNPEFDNYPVIFVSWQDARTFCEWRGARLPTEAEWEKAGRGTDLRDYPWGGETITCEQANYKNCDGDTSEVGSYPEDVSPYGIYDMSGNIREMTDSIYEPYPGGDLSAAKEYGRGYRTVRGGAFDTNDRQGRVSNRAYFPETQKKWDVGFRCAGTP